MVRSFPSPTFCRRYNDIRGRLGRGSRTTFPLGRPVFRRWTLARRIPLWPKLLARRIRSFSSRAERRTSSHANHAITNHSPIKMGPSSTSVISSFGSRWPTFTNGRFGTPSKSTDVIPASTSSPSTIRKAGGRRIAGNMSPRRSKGVTAFLASSYDETTSIGNERPNETTNYL